MLMPIRDQIFYAGTKKSNLLLEKITKNNKNNKKQQKTTKNNKKQQKTTKNNKKQQKTTKNNKKKQKTTKNRFHYFSKSTSFSPTPHCIPTKKITRRKSRTHNFPEQVNQLPSNIDDDHKKRR